MTVRRKILVGVAAAVLAAFFVFGVTKCVQAKDAQRRDRDRDRKEHCLDRGGIVRTDDWDEFDGCYYGNIPEIQG